MGEGRRPRDSSAETGKGRGQGQQKDRRCGGEGWVWRAGGRSQQRQHGPEAGPASVLALRPPRPGVWWASWAPAPAPHARLTILRPTPSSALGVFSTGHWGRVAALDKGAAAPPPGLSEHHPAPVTDPGDRPGDRPAPVESCPLLPGARCAEWKPPETVLPPFPPAGGSAQWLPPGAAASLAASQHGARKGRVFLGKRRVSWWLLRARYQRFSGQNYARRRMDHAERAARASVLCRGGAPGASVRFKNFFIPPDGNSIRARRNPAAGPCPASGPARSRSLPRGGGSHVSLRAWRVSRSPRFQGSSWWQEGAGFRPFVAGRRPLHR